MKYFVSLLVIVGILLLGRFLSNRRYVAVGGRLVNRWSGRAAKEFLVATGVLAAIALAVLLGGPSYRLMRRIGCTLSLAVFISVICGVVLFVLYERFLVFLMDIGDYNSRLRAREVAQRQAKRRRLARQQANARKARAFDYEESNRYEDRRRTEFTINSGAVEVRVEPNTIEVKSEEPIVASTKVIPFPQPTAAEEPTTPVKPVPKKGSKLFQAADPEAGAEEVSFMNLKVLAFRLGDCQFKVKDCGQTVLLRLTWTDEEGVERLGEWKLDKNSPDYLWVVEQTAAAEADPEAAREPCEAVQPC